MGIFQVTPGIRLAAFGNVRNVIRCEAGDCRTPAGRSTSIRGSEQYVLTGHGELKKSHGPMTADQHYQYVAAAIERATSRVARSRSATRACYLVGVISSTKNWATLQQSGKSGMLYLTVVGATRPLGSARDVVTLECYSADGVLQWSQKETNFFATSREQSLGKAAVKLEKSLENRFGSECLR